MNPRFNQVLSSSAEDRRDLFVTSARRLGTNERNLEKDFWVCWTLDALFHELPDGGPRLLFKGGTSLSKAFGLISRFSEDIDITVFRDDLGQGATVEELEAMERKTTACQARPNPRQLPGLHQRSLARSPCANPDGGFGSRRAAARCRAH